MIRSPTLTVTSCVIRHVAVFPVKLRVLPQFIFNSRDPIVMGVCIDAGVLKQGTPLCVPSKGVRSLSLLSEFILCLIMFENITGTFSDEQ